MAKIMIFGGHGKIAQLTSPLLTARGDEVTAVIRNPEHAEAVSKTGATPVVADLEQLDVTALSALMEGHDAIVWSAGAGGGSPERTDAVDREAAIRSMDAAGVAGVARYIMVSYFGASPEHGIDPGQPFFAYAEAKAAADSYLRGTALDWTVLGPSTLTLDDASGGINVNDTEPTQVSRGNVAIVIQAALADSRTIHRTIQFNDGSTPVAEALSA